MNTENTNPQEKISTIGKVVLTLVFVATALFPLYVHLTNQPQIITTTTPPSK